MPKKTKPTMKRTATSRARIASAAAKKPARKAPAKAATKVATKVAKPIDPEAMMAAWQKTMNPSDGHRRLEPIVGTFTAKTTFWMTNGQPPQVSDGVSEHRWVLGGRFVEQTYRGNMMGSSFEGIGFTGYDNVQKKYFGTWMDSMSTGIMISNGIGKPTDTTITMEGICHEPLVGATTLRSVIRIQDADHHSFELWRKGPNGKEFRNMLVEYTRK